MSSSMTDPATLNVLVIGVGAMGSGMALHLASLSEGYSVLAFDAHAQTLQKFKDSYPRSNEALTSKQLAISAIQDVVYPFPGQNSSPDVVIMMVVNSSQIDEFLFSEIQDGKSYVSTLPKECTIIIMSTCSPASVLSINERVRKCSACTVLDAPVSGGPARTCGKLSIMVSDTDMPSSAPASRVLRSLSNEGVSLIKFPKLKGYATAIGAGSMAKTLHQLLAGVHIAASAEVLSLAASCGLDLKTFYDLVAGGAAGNSWMFGDRGKRIVDAMSGLGVEVKSRVTIFIKDLGIVLDEARRASPGGLFTTTPLAEVALETFKRAVEMGLGDEDDSSLWKVYAAMSRSDEDDSAVFAEKNILEVGNEPRHKVKICNAYTRAILVQFPAGDTTLPHKHSVDSVYLFLQAAKVQNHVLGKGYLPDAMECFEVRYGTHCGCPLVHRIVADRDSAGVLCVDAEILSPPPVVLQDGTPVPEVEFMTKHELVKVRDKVRVFRLSVEPGESVEIEYCFYHLVVMCTEGALEQVDKSTAYSHTRNYARGDMDWSGPVGCRVLKNVGSNTLSYFVLQWRNFSL